MKKIILCLLAMLTLTGCGKNSNELVMVTEAGFSPYEYYENGEIVGVDIDIAKEIASSLGKKLVIKDVAFDSIINEVKTGKADFGAAGISYTEERGESVDFSNDYVTSKNVVVVKSDSKLTFKDINGKRIGVQLGSIGDTFATKNYPNSQIVRQKKYLAATQDLKTNKVDLIIMDELPAKETIKENTDLKILNGSLTSDDYGIIVKKGNSELLSAINEVINRLKSEGKIDEFILNHTTK